MTASMPYFQIYRGTNGQWYWRLKDTNYRTIADGSEGYISREGVIRAINNVAVAVRDSDQKIHE